MDKIKSNKEYRFKYNPEEKRFFEGFMEDRYDVYSFVSQVCFGKDNQSTHRDVTVFLSAIQWLGSPVGQYFLKNKMGYKVSLTNLSTKDQKEIQKLSKDVKILEQTKGKNDFFEVWDKFSNKFYNNESKDNK